MSIEVALLNILRENTTPNSHALFDASALYEQLDTYHTIDVVEERLEKMVTKGVIHRVQRGGTYWYGINS